MFPNAFFGWRYFTGRYWPKVGDDLIGQVYAFEFIVPFHDREMHVESNDREIVVPFHDRTINVFEKH